MSWFSKLSGWTFVLPCENKVQRWEATQTITGSTVMPSSGLNMHSETRPLHWGLLLIFEVLSRYPSYLTKLLIIGMMIPGTPKNRRSRFVYKKLSLITQLYSPINTFNNKVTALLIIKCLLRVKGLKLRKSYLMMPGIRKN